MLPEATKLDVVVMDCDYLSPGRGGGRVLRGKDSEEFRPNQGSLTA